MFGKIKGKFKNILKKTEEIIKEDEEEELIKDLEEDFNNFKEDVSENEKNEENVEEEKESNEEVNKKDEKSFFKRLFSKSDDDKKDNKEEEQFNDEVNKEEAQDILDVEENNKIKTDEEKKFESEKQEEDKLTSKNKEKESFIKKAFSKISKRKITEEDFDRIWTEIEIYLLDINIAFEVCEKIKEDLQEKLINKEFTIFTLKETILETLINEVKDILKKREGNFLEKLREKLKSDRPIKILMLGINGTGKTTTITKLYYLLKKKGISSVISASDTFRAAAIEQLEEHAKKLGFKLIKHDMGSDPAAVAFDAVKHAESKKIDVVIIDSAGRMANNKNLMEELRKIKRVIQPHFIIFVGDSNSGSDLIEQINLFDKNLNISGVILTKVDTDERPGSIVTTAYTVDKPIYFLGIGQNYDDLVEFDSGKIAKELFE